VVLSQINKGGCGIPTSMKIGDMSSSLATKFLIKNDVMENLGLIHAKQLAFRDCYIPPALREKIEIDWKNLTIRKRNNKHNGRI